MPWGTASQKTAPASEQDRPDVARKRARWKARQGSIDPKPLVFIDETWAKTNMAPLRGRAARGQRLIGRARCGHRNCMTFVAALRHDAIIAPWVIDGPINGESLRTYVDQVLVPELREGDIVVMDNPGSHKAPAIRRAICATRAKLFCLPASSPDVTPIEQVIAKLKHMHRKAAERTKEAVWRRIGSLLDHFTPQECENDIRNPGYASVQRHQAPDGGDDIVAHAMPALDLKPRPAADLFELCRAFGPRGAGKCLMCSKVEGGEIGHAAAGSVPGSQKRAGGHKPAHPTQDQTSSTSRQEWRGRKPTIRFALSLEKKVSSRPIAFFTGTPS